MLLGSFRFDHDHEDDCEIFYFLNSLLQTCIPLRFGSTKDFKTYCVKRRDIIDFRVADFKQQNLVVAVKSKPSLYSLLKISAGLTGLNILHVIDHKN